MAIIGILYGLGTNKQKEREKMNTIIQSGALSDFADCFKYLTPNSIKKAMIDTKTPTETILI
ncbi:Uncharacterised protein [Mycoplasmopsis edwardii]|uniref:Uncharacterized protein n=1 Tax=Mycoplasmopsis edwardii TaxID=53558 RepID=A0A3B0PME9_9BACT|nr:Uncharacterised protein [Mycoplasmopsis edwardii]